MRSARVVGTVLAGTTLAASMGAALLLVTHPLSARLATILGGLATLGVVTAALGAWVTWRVAGNAVGPLLTGVGLGVALLSARDVYYRVWLADRDALPLNAEVVAWLDESAWWLFATIALLLLVFPTGHVPSRRWRLVPGVLVASTAVVHLTGPFETIEFSPPMQDIPRPYGAYPLSVELVSTVAFVVVLACGLACGLSLVFRYRRATGDERARVKWLSFAGFGLATYPLACLVELALTGGTDRVAGIIGGVALVALPVSVAVAMLRHQLYDVDRVIADAVSYVVVAAALVAAYAVAAPTLGLLVGRDSPAAAAGATAVCAVLLAPVHRRLRRVVDRRLFPQRRAAIQAVEDLQHRIHSEGARPEELEQVLRTALRDPGLRVGLLVPGEAGIVDARGDGVPDTGLTPVTLGDTQIGVLAASHTTPPAVLRETASAAAALVEVIRLRAELAGALREVEASRSRLIQVGDAERRRLERDLHDGAQQRLVALGMSLRRAQRHLSGGDVDVDGLLDQSVAELATAVSELRQIAHGLRPTSLDDGLHAALAALTSKLPIPVRLDVPVSALGDEVATTAYFVAAEAITNAAKYSYANAIDVRVTSNPTGLAIRIRDDGIGGAEPRIGSGLSGLADRVAAVGGALRVTSPIGSGTTIEAELPCEW